MDFGFAAGGAAQGMMQGFNQARQSAIQQAYIKLQQQHQQMLQQQMDFNQQRQQQNDLARPLENVFDKFPRLAGSVGPAIQNIREPGNAQYQPTLADQSAPSPDPMTLERPEQQPLSGRAAIMPSVRNAYEQTAAAGKEEHDQDIAMKKSAMEANMAIKEALAKSLVTRRGVQNEGDEAKIRKGKLPDTKEQTEITHMLDARDRAYSLMHLIESGRLPQGGNIRSAISDFGGQVNAALGTHLPLENPDLNAINKVTIRDMYRDEAQVGGMRLAASPQMFEKNKYLYQNTRYMNVDTLKQVAANSINAWDASIANARNKLAATGKDSSMLDARADPRIMDPDELMGRKVNPRAMEALKRAAGAPDTTGQTDNLGNYPGLTTLRPSGGP
jgi:hypothetical protein